MTHVLVTNSNGITTLTLNRPEKRNAMDGQMITELLKALQHAAEDLTTRVLMILGAGDHFCAGADIAWMQKIATASYEANVADARKLADLIFKLYIFPKPTIVLAHGVTVGGGMGLVAAADIVLASQNASFAFSEVKLGIAPSIVSPYVIAAIGERAAHFYFLTGERFFADVAHRLGLVHQLTADNALASSGSALAETILKNSPTALVSAKQLLRRMAKEKITENLAHETAENLAQLRSLSEAQEGFRAFLEKREPRWG